jgi:predicted transcriptional regulator of viral defense system
MDERRIIEQRQVESRIAGIASRRYGLIEHGAARRAGLTDAQIRHRVDRGVWERIVPGVYRIAGTPESYEHAALAAALVAGRDALVSDWTAAAFFGVGVPPVVPHITVPKTSSARTRVAVVHRSNVPAADRTTVGVIPCTTPARVLVDITQRAADSEVRSATDSLLSRRATTPSEVHGSIRRAGKGRHGIPKLLDALAVWSASVRPGSPAEARLLRLLEDWRFPTPERQLEVRDEGGVVIATLDLGWRAWLVGLEYQSDEFHTPRDDAHDVGRLEAVRALGWWVGEVYKEDVRPSSRRLRDEVLPRLRRATAA